MDLSGEEYHQARQSRDWLSITLVALAILALLAAVAITIYSLLQQLLPGLPPLFPADSIAISWPFGLETTFIVQAGLLLLSLFLYLLARHRLVNNRALQAGSGCPACQERDLVRVRRRRRDRLMTLSGIRVARYECRNCTWGGLRIYPRRAASATAVYLPGATAVAEGDTQLAEDTDSGDKA